jgi:hypothetical protein
MTYTCSVQNPLSQLASIVLYAIIPVHSFYAAGGNGESQISGIDELFRVR